MIASIDPLVLWQHEVRAGTRERALRDTLWLAASLWQNATDCDWWAEYEAEMSYRATRPEDVRYYAALAERARAAAGMYRELAMRALAGESVDDINAEIARAERAEVTRDAQ